MRNKLIISSDIVPARGTKVGKLVFPTFFVFACILFVLTAKNSLFVYPIF
jgi:hypothetical protein